MFFASLSLHLSDFKPLGSVSGLLGKCFIHSISCLNSKRIPHRYRVVGSRPRYYAEIAQEEEDSPERGTAKPGSESLKTKLVQLMEEANPS